VSSGEADRRPRAYLGLPEPLFEAKEPRWMRERSLRD
jgi:hypothetical protein